MENISFLNMTAGNETNLKKDFSFHADKTKTVGKKKEYRKKHFQDSEEMESKRQHSCHMNKSTRSPSFPSAE